jgi:hypothetical protein
MAPILSRMGASGKPGAVQPTLSGLVRASFPRIALVEGGRPEERGLVAMRDVRSLLPGDGVPPREDKDPRTAVRHPVEALEEVEEMAMVVR